MPKPIDLTPLRDATRRAAEVLAAYGRTMTAQLEAARPVVAAYDAGLKRQGRILRDMGRKAAASRD